MKKSFAVIGAGRYGGSLAKSLYSMGRDVLLVDSDPDRLKRFDGWCTAAVVADMTDEREIRALGLGNMDVVVTAMASNLNRSILAVAIAKEEGVKSVIAKSASHTMSSILEKVGADKTIIPEEEEGERSARILWSDTVLDYFRVGSNLSMVEMVPFSDWIGKSPMELNLRKNYNLNIIATKDDNGQWVLTDPGKKLEAGEKLLIVTDNKELGNLNME